MVMVVNRTLVQPFDRSFTPPCVHILWSLFTILPEIQSSHSELANFINDVKLTAHHFHPGCHHRHHLHHLHWLSHHHHHLRLHQGYHHHHHLHPHCQECHHCRHHHLHRPIHRRHRCPRPWRPQR